MWTHDEWTALGTFLYGVGTIGGSLAILGAAYIGSRTYDRWRKQKLAEHFFEQAETILTATFNTRRALSRVRDPMLWAAELSASENSLAEQGRPAEGSEQEKKRAITFNLYIMRLNAEGETQRELASCLPIARALFGNKLEKAIEDLLQQFQVVYAGASAQADFTDHTQPSFRSKIERSLWKGYHLENEENEVDLKIQNLVEEIENICQPKLRLE